MSTNEIAIPSSIIIQLFTAFNVSTVVKELFVGRATVGSNSKSPKRGLGYRTLPLRYVVFKKMALYPFAKS